MKHFWRLAYNIVAIPGFWILIQVAGTFSRKVRRGIRGRLTLFPRLKQQIAGLGEGKRVWFHASSLGEFEQAKPIIAELKRRHPEVKVIATFFSPSGYEHSRKYPLADVISYVPFDSPNEVRKFLDVMSPDVAVMVRYDVWPNHIWELERRKIPVIIANATMRRSSNRRLPVVRNFHHHLYNSINEILTVSIFDVQAFEIFSLSKPHVELIGDTRYDQVLTRSAEALKRQIVPERVDLDKKVFVAGSTWSEDEDIFLEPLIRLLNESDDFIAILVPHEPTAEHLDRLENELTGNTTFIRFSALNEYNNERIIIVDSIGVLLPLYAHAAVAFVGGSFRQGVHNVLEAAVFGIPVLFGPRHRNSQEPLMLVERGGAFVVESGDEFYSALKNLLGSKTARTTAGIRSAEFVRDNSGATDRFLQRLERYI